MLEKIKRHIAIGGAHAAARMVKLVESAKSEHVVFHSARFLLGVAGMKVATESNVNVNVGAAVGWIIDLSPPDKPDQPGTRIVDVTAQRGTEALGPNRRTEVL
jgi:hypothetical protein